MTDPNGHVCPECAVPRAGDGTPSCVCTLRASDALRDARTAEAAAAEDFDPLRIRPYVELGVRGAGGEPSDADADAEGGGGSGSGDEDASARTMRLGRVPADDTVALFRVEHGTPAPGARVRAGAGAGVGAGVGGETDGDRLAASDEQPGRRGRRTALLAAAGVVVAVVAAGFVSGLFSYDAPARDGALPDEVRASVPDPSTTSGSASASASAPRSSRSAVAVAPSSTGPSPSASASTASASPSSSASPSRSAGPSQSPESPAATGSAAPGQGTSPSNGQLSATLRRGDRGPEVTELQLRLRQLFLYNSKADGSYSRQVEDAVRRYQWARGITSDEQGVYGRATRASLESETREP
ncbi:peptidoglycan-binding domain-containing protein [Streptomyces sp. NPDC051639]|uniref:peptidoglycan-binding domain-containing protein n=1 Tax=Streptomyces sp. NPDC051639 TaxID=3155671 RepID=UPI00343A5DE6